MQGLWQAAFGWHAGVLQCHGQLPVASLLMALTVENASLTVGKCQLDCWEWGLPPPSVPRRSIGHGKLLAPHSRRNNSPDLQGSY